MIYDCGSDLEHHTAEAGYYDETHSDNKGVEPEGLATGLVNKSILLFTTAN